MTQDYFFKNGKWIGAPERTPQDFTIIRGYFDATGCKSASLNVLGLGFFKCYINGICINPDTFLPLSSDFEGTCDPVDEVISAHRIYVPSFDITPYVREGKNSIAIQYGGGWYTYEHRIFGLTKAIYCITVEAENGTADFVSDEGCKVHKGFVTDCTLTRDEHQDWTLLGDCFAPDYDDSAWENAVPTEGLETEYCSTDCPTDKVMYELPLKVVKKTENETIYDCGENTTGYPSLKITAPKGEKVIVTFSEELVHHLVSRTISSAILCVEWLGSSCILPERIIIIGSEAIAKKRPILMLISCESTFCYVALTHLAGLVGYEINSTAFRLCGNAIDSLCQTEYTMLIGVPSATVVYSYGISACFYVGSDIE